MSGGVPSLAAALLSAVCYATAAVAQERTAASGRKPTGGLWTLALVLQAAGAGLHAVALRYGSLTVVQALGALTLVLALPLHAALGRRRVRAREWRGAGLTVLGLVTLLLSTAPPGTERALSGAELVLLAAITAAAALALTRLPWGADLSVLRALRFATAAGAAFGIASCLTQGLAVHLAAQGLGAAVADPMLLVAAGCTGVLAIAGMMWSQEAYRGGLGVALAAVTLANPLVAGCVGVLLLGEGFRGGSVGLAVALAGALAAGRGVVVLSRPTPSAGRTHRVPGPRPASPAVAD
ncbi:DMT family transporter [Actinacidiphila glaucinigra]|uniref:DMT family transporter n=1 Tax=Actinacidiphila glaucinigra TaxID=235986 RepID=UPI002E35C84E|nr:DMT family transporter [Actinacidiphila glaucinigra]